VVDSLKGEVKEQSSHTYDRADWFCQKISHKRDPFHKFVADDRHP
jgi:hypothetical protein